MFIELEEGIDGLVHVSDLSWTKKIKHPSEFVKVGEELNVVVLELDVENRRLALGHKQLEENPWDTFESVFTVGSKHKCTVLNKNEKGAVLELPYGIEGFAATKHLKKADDSMAEVGESLEFQVLEFSKDDKRIVLSHLHTHAKVEEAAPKKKAATGGGKKKSAPKQQASSSTLGDLDALSALKTQMEDDAKGGSKKKAASKKEEEPKAEAKKAAKKEEPKADEVKAETKKEEAKADEKEAKSEEKKEDKE
jgi:small subunit ribosomal protein S1